MNILPKKRWHVRTKDNIARVRRDEAEAALQEGKRLEKLKFAESEARINFLRRQSGIPERQCPPETDPTPVATNETEHIDLFADFKSHVKASNKELEKEQKEEREKYEKQIGYLTYLGQDTNEALKLRSWYEVAPKRSKYETSVSNLTEKDVKTKFTQDPLTLINALLPNEKKSKGVSNSNKASNVGQKSPDRCAPNVDLQHTSTSTSGEHNRKKHKKEKKSKKHKKKDKSHKKDKHHNRKKELETKQQQKRELIEKLRKERLKRENAERTRQDELLRPKETLSEKMPEEKTNSTPRVVQKYNSQFNPELAKQNIS